MREFFDFDPVTGVTEYYEEVDGKIHITSEQDVQPYLDYAAEMRNSGMCDAKRGQGEYKHEGRLYAILPPVVQAELFRKGINFLDPSQTGALLHEINTNYPRLKVSNLHHALKHK